MSLLKKLSFLSQFLRLKLIRQSIKIATPPEKLQVNVATSQEELEKAYLLLHDCYVGMKLMAPDSSGLRCNFFSFLPYTTTVVAKIGDAVVGTVSLTIDSHVGLPSDKDFKFENDQLRLTGHGLVEVSSLAIDPQFRNKAHVVSLYLMKYLQHYTTHYMGCTTVTCVIHPRARDFYAAFWGFKANKKIIKYKFVNDALGVHVYGNITDDNLKPLAKTFPKKENKNPIDFLFKSESFMIYPERKGGHHLDPIYTPQLLNYFMAERTQVYKSLSGNELQTIYNAYSLFFEKLEKLDIFKNISSSSYSKRNFRFPTKIQALLSKEQKIPTTGHIMDLSTEGAFFATDLNLELNKEYQMDFQLGSQIFSFQVVVCWQNRRTRNNQVVGYGIRFAQTQMGIARLLKDTHLSKSA